jgi:hypothetical protein
MSLKVARASSESPLTSSRVDLALLLGGLVLLLGAGEVARAHLRPAEVGPLGVARLEPVEALVEEPAQRAGLAHEVGHPVDEEEREHLDAQGPQGALPGEVRLDGALDLRPPHIEPAAHHLVGGGDHEAPFTAAGELDGAGLAVGADADLRHGEARVLGHLGVLLQQVALLEGDHLFPRGAVSLQHQHPHPRPDGPALHLFQPQQVGPAQAQLGHPDHLDLLHQPVPKRLDGGEPIDRVGLLLGPVGGRIAQYKQGLERADGLFRLVAAHVLRLVEDDHRPRRLDPLVGPPLARQLLGGLVEVVARLVEGLLGDDHDHRRRAAGEVADPAELGAVVLLQCEVRDPVELDQVAADHLEGLLHPFEDRHRGHHDDELAQPVALEELEHRAEVDVGLARARLHLEGEVRADV